ncbi:MAG: rhodanese-like domain-containing protein [Ardenticatenaceae bacterium]|nr:rhodanese-like domain-containing protein [Ardenticatenaceae bacterium]
MGIFDWLFGPKVPQITVQEAQQRLQNDKGVVIVDVRQPVETQSGVVPGAVLIPLTELGRRMDELPSDRPILTICASSHRSPMAARRLAKAGYDVTDVAGGMGAWMRAGLPVEKRE